MSNLFLELRAMWKEKAEIQAQTQEEIAELRKEQSLALKTKARK